MQTFLSTNRKDPSNARMKPRALRSNVTSFTSVGGVNKC